MLALAAGLVAPHAAAQSDEERAGARAAAGQGLKALQEHRWADAVDLFTRAESLVDAPPHRLYLAEAETQLGQLVKAHENLEKVVRTHLGPDAPGAFRDAQKQAELEIGQIEERLAYVTVTVDGAGSAAVTVTQDGKPIPDALLGVPRPIDPGSHSFQATAPGLQAVATIDMKEKAHETVALKLSPAAGGAPVVAPAAAAPVVAAPVATAPENTSPTAPPPAPAPEEAKSGGNGLRIGSYVAFGVGVVGLGLGTVFALNAKSKQNDGDTKFDAANCGVGCPDQQASIQSIFDSASSARTIATIGFVAGGVGVATGVVLFIVSAKHGDSEHATAQGPTVHPWIDARSAGVFGTF